MNHISFLLEVEKGPANHIVIDGQPLPFSQWLDWHEILDSLEQSGYWYILSCSCGKAACAGLDPVLVFHADGIIAWHVKERGYTARFCFEARQMKQAVQEALEVLGWLHFFRCDGHKCHCPSTEYTDSVLKYYRRESALWGWDGSAVDSGKDATPTSKLLGAICQGDLAAVACWADAGADLSHVSVLESCFMSLHTVFQTALMFAPKAEVLPAITLLLNKGADVHHSVRDCPDFMHDILVMRDVDVWPYLAAQIQDMGSQEELERRYLENMGEGPPIPTRPLQSQSGDLEMPSACSGPKGEAS